MSQTSRASGVTSADQPPPVARRLLSFRSSSATTATRSKPGIAALGSRAGNYHGRFVIVVDDDIDPSDMKEVIWAVSTRCDPKTAISIIDGCWSTPLDPAMHPDQRDAGNFINSRAILNACRPYAWRDRFPPVNALSAELKKKIEEKWKKELA